MKKTKLLALSVTLSCSVLLAACGDKTTKINASDYLTVTIEGSQSYGIAGYTVDVEKMVQDNYEAFGLKKDYSDGEYSTVLNNIRRLGKVGSMNKNSSLSNGDTVTYTWNQAWLNSMEATYKVDFESSEPVTQEVTTLVEPQEFNPFDYVTITYEKVPDDDPQSKKNYAYGKDLKITIEESDECPVEGLILNTSHDYVNYGEEWHMVYLASGRPSIENYCLEKGFIITEYEKYETAPTSLDS